MTDPKKIYDIWPEPLPKPSLGDLVTNMVSQNQDNYNIANSNVDHLIERASGRWKRPVHFRIFDTAVKSRSEYLQKNYVDDGEVWTDENSDGYDRNNHWSHCTSSIVGHHPKFRMGVFANPDIRDDYWSFSGEKMLTDSGFGNLSWFEQAGYAAIKKDKKRIEAGQAVIWSCSFGGPTWHPGVARMTMQALNAGIIIVVAAGNTGSKGINHPGNIPAVLTIGAVDKNNRVAHFSSRGDLLDFMGVGVNINGATSHPTKTMYSNGTSMSTPNVAAMAGLVAMIHPRMLDSADMKEVLRAISIDLGIPGRDSDYGLGVLDLKKYQIEQPEQPEQPDEPEQPEQPDEPEQPEQPDEPEQPEQPDEPEQPEQPDEPGEPAPRVTLNIESPKIFRLPIWHKEDGKTKKIHVEVKFCDTILNDRVEVNKGLSRYDKAISDFNTNREYYLGRLGIQLDVIGHYIQRFHNMLMPKNYDLNAKSEAVHIRMYGMEEWLYVEYGSVPFATREKESEACTFNGGLEEKSNRTWIH